MSEPRLKKLAVIVTRGTSNNLFQVATLVRAATALEASVEVLFRDDALTKLRNDRIDTTDWSPIYASVLPDLRERLRSADFVDMSTFLQDAKEHGDDVHFWASTESLKTQGQSLTDLTPLLDGEQKNDSFVDRVRDADALMTF